MNVKVMLVDEDAKRGRKIKTELENLSYQVMMVTTANLDVMDSITEFTPDIIIADIESPRRDTVECLSRVQDSYPQPMVMLTEHKESLQKLEHIGLSGYVVEGISPQWVRAIVDITLSMSHQQKDILQELQDTKTALSQQKAIGQAKCLLMENMHCGEKEAYHSMRKFAMSHRLKLSEVAQKIIERYS